MLLQSQLGGLADIKVFQADLEAVSNILTTTRSRGLSTATTTAKHTTTKELREQIFSIHASSHATLTVQTLFSKLIIYFALLRIRKNFISVRDFFELITSLWVLFKM
jgi:hypothetical protein